VNRRERLPDRFGATYRDAVFAARPRNSEGIALAWVLLDEVYRSRSTSVELGYALLRDLTHLHGRSIERGRNWLMRHGLLRVESQGRGQGARTLWTLQMSPAPAGVFSRPSNDRGGAASERPHIGGIEHPQEAVIE
jgi:hypothetical protein